LPSWYGFVALVALVLCVQLLVVPRFTASFLSKPSPDQPQNLDNHHHHHHYPPSCRVNNKPNPFLQDLICPHMPAITRAYSATLYDKTTTRDMNLAQEASRVAAEFDYSDHQVNKAVKEFIRQMSAFSSHSSERLELTIAQRRGSAERGRDHEPDSQLRYCRP
jgi:hypothetical protein